MRKRHDGRESPQCQGMVSLTDLASVPFDPLAAFTDRLLLAVTAYLAPDLGAWRRRPDGRTKLPAWVDLRGSPVPGKGRSLTREAFRPHHLMFVYGHGYGRALALGQ